MIVYKNTESGEAINIRPEKDNYSLAEGEKSIPGEKTPDDISSLHTQEYKDLLVQKTINEDARKYINEIEWKIQRHLEQLELVTRGKRESTKITDQEYEDLLIERDRQRDLIIE